MRSSLLAREVTLIVSSSSRTAMYAAERFGRLVLPFTEHSTRIFPRFLIGALPPALFSLRETAEAVKFNLLYELQISTLKLKASFYRVTRFSQRRRLEYEQPKIMALPLAPPDITDRNIA